MFRCGCRRLCSEKGCTGDDVNCSLKVMEEEVEQVNNELRSSNLMNTLSHQSFYTKLTPLRLAFTGQMGACVRNDVSSDIFHK